ncbi:MAG: DUF5808 domain-containing protein [Holophagaceae bacterium]
MDPVEPSRSRWLSPWDFCPLLVGVVFAGLLPTLLQGVPDPIPNLDPGEHYRWGLFYVNPEDPSIWVPKLFGLGWTLNFAHGISWLFLALLLLVPAILIGLAASR